MRWGQGHRCGVQRGSSANAAVVRGRPRRGLADGSGGTRGATRNVKSGAAVRRAWRVRGDSRPGGRLRRQRQRQRGMPCPSSTARARDHSVPSDRGHSLHQEGRLCARWRSSSASEPGARSSSATMMSANCFCGVGETPRDLGVLGRRPQSSSWGRELQGQGPPTLAPKHARLAPKAPRCQTPHLLARHVAVAIYCVKNSPQLVLVPTQLVAQQPHGSYETLPADKVQACSSCSVRVGLAWFGIATARRVCKGAPAQSGARRRRRARRERPRGAWAGPALSTQSTRARPRPETNSAPTCPHIPCSPCPLPRTARRRAPSGGRCGPRARAPRRPRRFWPQAPLAPRGRRAWPSRPRPAAAGAGLVVVGCWVTVHSADKTAAADSAAAAGPNTLEARNTRPLTRMPQAAAAAVTSGAAHLEYAVEGRHAARRHQIIHGALERVKGLRRRAQFVKQDVASGHVGGRAGAAAAQNRRSSRCRRARPAKHECGQTARRVYLAARAGRALVLELAQAGGLRAAAL